MSDQVEWIEVTWGPMTFTPAQYSSFKVGPYTARVAAMPGQSREEVFDRAMAMLKKKGEAEFRETVAWFKGALRQFDK